MRKSELNSERELRRQLFICIYQEVEQLENHCARFLQTSDPVSFLKMQSVMKTLVACYQFLQLRRLLIYLINAGDFLSLVPILLRAGAEEDQSGSLSIVREELAGMAIKIATAAELCSFGTSVGIKSAESLLSISAVNRLRIMQQKKPLADPCTTPPQLSPYALLAQYRLQACLLHACSINESDQDIFSSAEELQSFAGKAPVDGQAVMQLAITEIGWQLRQILVRHLSMFERENSDLTNTGCYELASDCNKVRRVAAFLSHSGAITGVLRDTFSILDVLVRMIWVSLRYPGADKAWITRQLHSALCLLILCIELETFTDPDHESGQRNTSRLRSTLRVIRKKFLAKTYSVLKQKPPVLYPPIVDNRQEIFVLQSLIQCEFNEYLKRLHTFTASSMDGDNREFINPDLCLLLHKLAIDLQTLGYFYLFEKADSLQKILSNYMKQQWRLEPTLQNALQKFTNELQKFCTAQVHGNNAHCAANMVSEIALDPDACEFLELEVITQQRCHSQIQIVQSVSAANGGINNRSAKEPDQESALLPVQLASTIRLLPVAENELLEIFKSATALADQWLPMARRILGELQLLVKGAHALKVYRVEALSGVMLELYQQALSSMGTAQEVCSSPRWQSLVLRGHRKLRTMLNQAAAHQEVSSARTVIAALYHWLESQPGAATGDLPPERRETEDLPAQIAEATISRLPYNSKQHMVQRQVLLHRRDTAIPAVALKRLTRLTEGCLLNQQRLYRHLHTGNSRSGLVSAQLRELLSVQSEKLQLIRQQLQVAQMTSLSQWRGRFERLTGRVSNEQNKQVRLQLQGCEIAIERILLEYLQTALEQLLRHVICHGVETTLVRRQTGKPETATITLAAQNTGNTLMISMSDDGAGQETEKGAGLEIVEKSVTTIGCRLVVSSVLHEGSSFRVILPRSQYNGGL